MHNLAIADQTACADASFYSDLPHAAKTLKAASIARRIAAIAYYHEQAGHPSPMAHPIVKNVWKGVRREIGIAQKGKSSLTIDGLRPVVATFRRAPDRRP